jgi:membrane fusion protein (multidrug efflux system)
MAFDKYKNNKSAFFAGAVCLVVFVALIFHLIDQHRFIRSDDALIEAHFTTLSARVPGIVQKVFVDEHEHVFKNQVLAKIEPRDYAARSDQATATEASTNTELTTAREDLARAQILWQKHDLSQESYEHIQAHFQQEMEQVKANRALSKIAEINRDYTFIRAPEDGIIALRSANAGMEVQQGDPLFGIVYPKTKWVEAKIKETDLRDLKIGETVQVKIDAIPGKKFQGTLESISPSSEGLEATIVPDNGAGNFTKYVQRVAVRVALPDNAENLEAVRVGLSAQIRISRKAD